MVPPRCRESLNLARWCRRGAERQPSTTVWPAASSSRHEPALSELVAYRQRFDDSVDSAMCRVCGAAEESIEHLV
ncbi:hypothetical protein MTO96_021582 [Rhipicephalus appendiculatus]